ncbi:MAG: RNA polymerase sigma factor [Jatrophihabitans sp.]
MPYRQPRSLTARRRAADTAGPPADLILDALSAAVHEAQQGGEHAFSTMYRTVQPGLLRYLTALVGAEAEDVASETWLQVCRDLHTFSGDGDGFRGWVATIGRHRALDHIRARGRRPADPYPAEALVTIASTEDTAAAAAEALSTAAALSLIGSLPVDQAEAVLLRTVVGLDAVSTGRVLGKRPGAVRMSTHRGLRSLARRLAEPAGLGATIEVGGSAGVPGEVSGVTAVQPDALNEMS